MTDIRSHPDYAEGYEARWYRRRPRPEAEQSLAYEAGYASAGAVGDMFPQMGMQQNAAGEWIRQSIADRRVVITGERG